MWAKFCEGILSCWKDAPQAVFVGPLQGALQSFVQSKRNPEPSSHVSAIVLPKPLAYAADNKNVFLKIRERQKKDSLYLSGKLCFSRAFDSRQEKA